MGNKIFYHLGNALIILSLAGIIFLVYPLLSMYFFPPRVESSLPASGSFITIPKIHAQAPVIENVDPWNEASYKEVLKKGVAQAKGTNFLFAHSSGNPWEVTRFNTIFFRIGELEKGDPIIMEKNGVKHQYIVKEKKEVWPTDVSYLKNPPKNELILQTCTPIGTSLKRLLVFAKKE